MTVHHAELRLRTASTAETIEITGRVADTVTASAGSPLQW